VGWLLHEKYRIGNLVFLLTHVPPDDLRRIALAQFLPLTTPLEKYTLVHVRYSRMVRQFNGSSNGGDCERPFRRGFWSEDAKLENRGFVDQKISRGTMRGGDYPEGIA
jgi:hypothetical protein